jgi:predicted PP-loop superfamily ATPase
MKMPARAEKLERTAAQRILREFRLRDIASTISSGAE